MSHNSQGHATTSDIISLRLWHHCSVNSGHSTVHYIHSLSPVSASLTHCSESLVAPAQNKLRNFHQLFLWTFLGLLLQNFRIVLTRMTALYRYLDTVAQPWKWLSTTAVIFYSSMRISWSFVFLVVYFIPNISFSKSKNMFSISINEIFR